MLAHLKDEVLFHVRWQMFALCIGLYKRLQCFHDPVVLVEEECVDGGEGGLDHCPHVSAGQILFSGEWMPGGKATLGSAWKMSWSKMVVSLQPGSRKS